MTMTKKQKLELTWIGEEVRPRLGPRPLSERCEESLRGPLQRHRMAAEEVQYGNQ